MCENQIFSNTVTADILLCKSYGNKIGFLEIKLDKIEQCPNRHIYGAKFFQR